MTDLGPVVPVMGEFVALPFVLPDPLCPLTKNRNRDGLFGRDLDFSRNEDLSELLLFARDKVPELLEYSREFVREWLIVFAAADSVGALEEVELWSEKWTSCFAVGLVICLSTVLLAPGPGDTSPQAIGLASNSPS